jgi:hypothetical protein
MHTTFNQFPRVIKTQPRSLGGVHRAPMLLAIAGAAACVLAGCSANESTDIASALRPHGRTLSPEDFVSPGSGPAATPPNPTTALQITSPAEAALASDDALNVNTQAPRELDLGGNSPDIGADLSVTAAPGVPILSTLPVGQPLPVGGPAFVDAKVGDINGKPIFASTFFDRGTLTLEPLGPRLQQEAARRKPEEWRDFARKEIQGSLDSLIEDELLRAEAFATLTPEQKQGFFAFIQQLQKGTVSEAGGSAEAANERLKATEGLSLDEFLSQRQQSELIRFQLSEKIVKRVQVSRRDIELAYERFNAQFNPPPEYLFRIVATEPETVSAVQARIDAGEPFKDLASSDVNSYKRETGGLESRKLEGEIEKAAWFAGEALNTAARTLGEGKTVGPFAFGRRKAWLHLETVVRKSTPIYDAQLAIENVLRSERIAAERKRYIARLRSKASMSDVQETAARLLEIAESRYLP